MVIVPFSFELLEVLALTWAMQVRGLKGSS